jgi:polyhydroxyalkanoate synthase
VINPPAANKHGFWTGDKLPASADQWLEGAARHEGSWWPLWTNWLTDKGSKKQVAAQAIADGIEPAPGSYAKMP